MCLWDVAVAGVAVAEDVVAVADTGGSSVLGAGEPRGGQKDERYDAHFDEDR